MTSSEYQLCAEMRGTYGDYNQITLDVTTGKLDKLKAGQEIRFGTQMQDSWARPLDSSKESKIVVNLPINKPLVLLGYTLELLVEGRWITAGNSTGSNSKTYTTYTSEAGAMLQAIRFTKLECSLGRVITDKEAAAINNNGAVVVTDRFAGENGLRSPSWMNLYGIEKVTAPVTVTAYDAHGNQLSVAHGVTPDTKFTVPAGTKRMEIKATSRGRSVTDRAAALDMEQRNRALEAELREARHQLEQAEEIFRAERRELDEATRETIAANNELNRERKAHESTRQRLKLAVYDADMLKLAGITSNQMVHARTATHLRETRAKLRAANAMIAQAAAAVGVQPAKPEPEHECGGWLGAHDQPGRTIESARISAAAMRDSEQQPKTAVQVIADALEAANLAGVKSQHAASAAGGVPAKREPTTIGRLWRIAKALDEETRKPRLGRTARVNQIAADAWESYTEAAAQELKAGNNK